MSTRAAPLPATHEDLIAVRTEAPYLSDALDWMMANGRIRFIDENPVRNDEGITKP